VLTKVEAGRVRAGPWVVAVITDVLKTVIFLVEAERVIVKDAPGAVVVINNGVHV